MAAACTRCLLALALAAAVLSPAGAATAAGRALKQQDALSNSNACLASIPKCEPGACATRNVMGTARWVCLRCLANYEPVVDASGQDNIVQCVCPKGFFEGSPNATSCVRCTANSYCPGGDKVENPASRGAPVACGSGLVTRNTGARSQADCVAPAGYAQTSPNQATPCDRSSYAPMYNRLAKCLKCQSGLEEPANSNLAVSQRDSKRAVCKIPPGKYVSQGLVRICPQGFYRENYVPFDAAVGTLCLPCKPGITTNGAGAQLAAECNRVLPGYGIAEVLNVTGPASIPALPQDAEGLPNATVCDIGFYSSGGYCAECPAGSVTRVKGAKSIEECAVPPGYWLRSGVMAACPSGFFREGWLMASDPRATSCTPCGAGIASDPKDLDENPRATNGSLTRATSASCFIEAGQGMIAQGKNTFVAQDCPINTYGAAGKVYGWAAAPCKPCARNMITDGATKVNNSDVCINDAGFGYATEGASRCAPGFYSAKGSRKPCQQCPPGRTTADNATLQQFITHCYVQPGSGVATASNTSDGFAGLNTTGWTDETLVALPVLQCPLAYYGVGLTLGAVCTPCPAGTTTQELGASSITQCNVCIPGYGKPTNTSLTCSPCPYGSWQPGGQTVCTLCQDTPFYSPVDGAGETVTSTGTTTFMGATGPEFCVPRRSQLSPEAGQAYFVPGQATSVLMFKNPPTLTACFGWCQSNMCCLAQYNTTNATAPVCTIANMQPVARGAPGVQLLVKLPPSAMGAASSVRGDGEEGGASRAATISSGIYARCAANAAPWRAGQVGSNLGPDARTFTTAGPQWDVGVASDAVCIAKCDDSNVCWGFVWDAANSSCLYRGGVDALRSRSFLTLPDNVDTGSLQWQQGPTAQSTCQVRIRPTTPPTSPGALYINLAEVQLFGRDGSMISNNSIAMALSTTLPWGPASMPLAASFCNDGATFTQLYINSLVHTGGSPNTGAGQICSTASNDLYPVLTATYPCGAGLSRVLVHNRWDYSSGSLGVAVAQRIMAFTLDVVRDAATLQSFGFPTMAANYTMNVTAA